VPAVLTVREHVSLAPYCTMAVGGLARYFAEARDEGTLHEALVWATARGLDLFVLGGGSNLVVADEGVDGLVIKVALRGISWHAAGSAVELAAAAGEPWDDVVRHTVERGWAGLECLSGIPGLVGATPIQNVGAYGQEVSDVLSQVRALDRQTGTIRTMGPAECGFGYRDSAFKSAEPGRFVVLSVSYRLVPGGAPTVRYADVERDLEHRWIGAPSLADIRQSVLAIRRAKSMVLDAEDENRRSCGSFFLNPIITAGELRRVEKRAGADAAMPRWPERDGRMKLSAAWLIERAGFARGQRQGAVGLSTRHTLAIVCHDGARARDVVGFARRLQAAVEERFGVRLRPEPVLWGLNLD
jgi:UDP-N-acetylmuramate dehydrogenase